MEINAMGMWPTATLTYGYDVTSATGDWYEDDAPDEAGSRALHDAGFPEDFGIWRDYDGDRMRLYAAYLGASGYNARGEVVSLELPDGVVEKLRQAAELLGIDIGDAEPRWLLVAEFN